MPDFTDRPASHADAHAEGLPCGCHGKTEAEIARPYALFALALCGLLTVAVLVLALVLA